MGVCRTLANLYGPAVRIKLAAPGLGILRPILFVLIIRVILTSCDTFQKYWIFHVELLRK